MTRRARASYVAGVTSDPTSGSRRHVVVVGGGISGLAAAERLARDEGVDVTVVEADVRLGGIVQTERVDGFLIERGPDVVVAAKPATRALCERLGIADRLHGTSVRGAYVSRRGRLRRLPQGLSGLMPTRLAPLALSGLLSPWGLLRVAAEPLRASGDPAEEETVAAFMVRRLGREMYERISEPLLTGIYAGAGTRLSIDATFPQLRAMERSHGSLLRGFRARAAAPAVAPAVAPAAGEAAPSPFLSLPTGMGELVETLEATLARSGRVVVRRATPVRAIVAPEPAAGRPARVTLDGGETLACDAVIVATPAPMTATLLHPVDPLLSREIGAIEQGSTAHVTLGYPLADVPRALDATGYVVPSIEGRAVLACTWASSKLPGRAPADAALFRLFVGGARRPELVDRPDDELVAIARAELAEMLGVRAAPRLVRVTRWRGAMPQYHVGHVARVERIEARAAAHRWLGVAGNAYRGVGVPDCIASGERAAERVLAGFVPVDLRSAADGSATRAD